MKARNNYPRRRFAKGRAEMRRQRLLHAFLAARREFIDFMVRPHYVPKNWTPYEPQHLGSAVQFIHEGSASPAPEETPDV
jgi:hypothetical protein